MIIPVRFFSSFWGMAKKTKNHGNEKTALIDTESLLNADIFAHTTSNDDYSNNNNNTNNNSSDVPGRGSRINTAVMSPFYTSLTTWTLKLKYVIVIAIIMCVIPALPYVSPMRSDALTPIVPRGFDSLKGFEILTNDFGAGIYEPYK